MTLRIADALDRHPDDHIAVIDDEGVHTWGQLRRRAWGAAAAWREVQPGDHVGLLVRPGAAWVASLMALWHRGAAAVPLSALHPGAERGRLLDDAKATHWVVEPAEASAEVRQTQLAPAWADACGEPGRAQRHPGETALILFTSGTTGRPKGAQLTQHNLAHQSKLLSEAWRLGGTTRLLHALPLHHMHGIAIALMPTLFGGGAARFLPRFDADAVWEAFGEVNVWMSVPTMYHRLLAAFDEQVALQDERRARAAALKLCTSGSAALPVTLAARWQELHGHIPLERYGMTEIGVGCSNPFDAAARRRGTVGPSLPTQEMRIVDADGADADEGEVWVRGPSVFAGYFERPEANDGAFVDGWFKTGDVGRFEDGGYLKLLGRNSVDIIKSGGYKLSALEIEEVFRNHPAIDQVAVVGIPAEAWGEAAVAAIVPRGEPIDPDTLRTWSKQHLAAYKVPRRVVPVEALPRNALGKVTKKALVAQLEVRLAGQDL